MDETLEAQRIQVEGSWAVLQQYLAVALKIQSVGCALERHSSWDTPLALGLRGLKSDADETSQRDATVPLKAFLRNPVAGYSWAGLQDGRADVAVERGDHLAKVLRVDDSGHRSDSLSRKEVCSVLLPVVVKVLLHWRSMSFRDRVLRVRHRPPQGEPNLSVTKHEK